MNYSARVVTRDKVNWLRANVTDFPVSQKLFISATINRTLILAAPSYVSSWVLDCFINQEILRSEHSRYSVRLSQDIDDKSLLNFHEVLYSRFSQNSSTTDIFKTFSLKSHNFTVRRFIVLPFKHQTKNPTAISAQHNQWQYKHNTAELQTTVTAGSDYFPQHKIKSPPLTLPTLHHLSTCTLTTSNVHLTNTLPTHVPYLHHHFHFIPRHSLATVTTATL